jgi:hypothetical protein
MRVVAWNCGKAAARKLPVLLDRLKPDVAVISECSDEATLLKHADLPECSMAWVGRDPSCGLAVLAFGGWTAELDEDARTRVEGMEWACPARVDGPTPFRLLGIWADNSTRRRPATEAVRALEDWFVPGRSMVAGDFNNDTFWNKGGDERDHTVTVELLRDQGLSAIRNELPTYHQNKNPEKPYILDHVFVPGTWGVRGFEVGSLEQWTTLSDHAPIIVDLDVPACCPSCGVQAAVPIIYGLPGPELFEAAVRGELMLGGCEPEQPNAACTACGVQWYDSPQRSAM